MQKLLDFLNRLEQEQLAYSLEHNTPEAIMVLVAVPGERWEVEFFMVQRDGPTRFKVVEDTKAATLQAEIIPNVKPGSTVNTDEWIGYRGLSELYQHEVIKHSEDEYVRYEDDKTVHTNTIENRWSHFRRTLTGTYHSVSPKHLQRYADESAFRLSTFEMEEGERFDLSISQCEGRLTYEQLVHSPEWYQG